jgi:penicillin-binding protein 1C
MRKVLKYIFASTLVLSSIFFLHFFLPNRIFNTTYSPSVSDQKNQIISARVASDGQWRLSSNNALPEKFKIALLTFEDKGFYHHTGISFKSLIRAIYQNIKKKKIFSGGSTITMQVMRMSAQHKKRNFSNKISELFLAYRLELAYSKDSILQMYAAHAPFGSNVVGIEAASIKYFGHSADELSWAEAATLAVLPNSPAIIFPGKNQLKLKQKRNGLLQKLFELKYLDDVTYFAATSEPLPQRIYNFPNDAYHLLDACLKQNNAGSKNFQTYIHYDLQIKTQQILQQHKLNYYANEIHNAALIIIDVKQNKVIAYQGNINEKQNQFQNNVDIIQSQRSTGSLLKPYLYAHMLQAGELLPEQLVADIPTQISGFTPQNYALTYDGAVPAKNALARSLNIPAVRLLKQYGVNKFLDDLQNMGFSSFKSSADHYGLSLILGGGESSLYELSAIYANMAQKLENVNASEQANLYLGDAKKQAKQSKLSKGAIYQTFDAMLDVMRPDVDVFWRRFGKSRKIAWKTGTSFGYRDAWAIGLTPDYVVGVWIGNATGEGRPNLTGIDMAAPILFETFNLLPQKTNWFQKPEKEFEAISICTKSGHPASIYCQNKKNIARLNVPLHVGPCPYHKIIQTDISEQNRVTQECANGDIKNTAWFVLPPAMEHYYVLNHTDYKQLPPWRTGCQGTLGSTMELIYPEENAKIYIPKEIDNTNGKSIFELAHRNKNAIIFWYLDGEFLGKTNLKNQMAISTKRGYHKLTVTDNLGQTITCNFEILSK